ncbi:hypothetical protein AVW11_03880 [Streptomyces amritsarensis]|uniref:Uncharacterized protein n=1 Tax=Streptomyces amritsarensis TaxID=681158 RepID=A0ABX3G8S9_9ACTN|nr:hypothetical protein [Streptomyces amritsarensis]OLZ72540.1 hypothetical protein AVW11_03880 [Streptomyces amritsarensis]
MTDDLVRCVNCRRALWGDERAAGCRACRRCEEDAARDLRELPGLFRGADQTNALIKGGRTETGARQPSTSSAPVNLFVLSLTAVGGAVTTLQAIEDSWRRALGWSMGLTRHRADIDGATSFLINNLRWACENYDEVAHDLRTIARTHAALSNIQTGQRAPRLYSLSCSTIDCAGRMRVTLFDPRATCPDCGQLYERQQLDQLDSEFGPNPTRTGKAA